MQDFVQHLINGVSLGSIYALIALGYTMVYGILKMINFAHSDVYMVGAFAAYYFARWLGIENNPGFSTLLTLIVITMICCSLLGLVIERLAYRPLRNSPKLNVLITAIGVSLFLQYSGQVVFGADPKVFPEVMKDFVIFSIGIVEVRSFDVTVLGVGIVAMLGLQFLLFKTKMGRAMRAVSANPMVASLMGVNPDRIIAFTFVVGSSLAGIGSVLVGMKYPKIDPLMGMMIGMKAFVAAVLGGIGNVGGAVLGAMIMGLSEEMVVAYLSSTYRDALAFGILIVILIFKPAGLLGKYSVEKV
ncbi:branched-chain amino acid ABC transporter permease [Bdellovibrio bacteriovorus]|uniref:Branched-chain amino acid ABC transporter, permease protein n=1 Tax=Bdellovibrio bacteriovorus (strain ATCC 15356 / DSM 50701 / NCIMB 9529 / HD100) TaxID=264462 RepID=Q6MHZ8_BDEBA|nr:branched-chain amino acid ABC transporter permease [Bdellovibrio bacteriovorus]AHZ83745.1 ABC transporter permease [Bdellovibrio bacteriovorus]BEV69718.1 High-affinity branched-chain amino acid transport system permease protein LivH [Bdellovibrio bacteriovorus]CAE78184.1 branched-chain amino acid ABC transporter, permease protein [Bdellovibrio bacteriovorus HD100]